MLIIMVLNTQRCQCKSVLTNLRTNEPKAISPWPAISDICLDVRTVTVLSVAKEVAARPADRSLAADRPNTGRAKRTDLSTIECKEILSFVCLLMFPSLLVVFIGRELPIECSKLTCFAKVKNRHSSRAVRATIKVGRWQSSCAYSEAEFDLGKGKNRPKATYPHSKDEDKNHHRHTNPNCHEYESKLK